MKDELETNLASEEAAKLNETNTPVETPEVTAEAAVVESDNAEENAAGKLTKEEILNRLQALVDAPIETVRGEVESLKQAYYKIRRNEVDELRKAFVEQGGDEKDFTAPEDTQENFLKELLGSYKEKKAAYLAEEEKQKAENYEIKLQLIEQLKMLCESQDDFNKLYNEFKDIQQKWKEIKLVPEEHANELWKEYQTYSEAFYDLIKINNQFRDYDFKKNLELKTALCEAVEKLQDEKDIISAFHQLQKLHQQWREIGPVAKELREELWGRFKAASTVINKRHQQHFENLKAKEQENLVAKTAICEEIEGIDYAALQTFKDWDEKNNEVLALQQKWRTIGFTPKKHNTKIFERFRAACDVFFTKKTEFYKSIKAEMEKNLEKNPRLWFGDGETNSVRDPRCQTEDLGDDAVKASEYGIRNLKREIRSLQEWTLDADDIYNRNLAEMYNQIVQQFMRYNGHVMAWIGGMYNDFKTPGQYGDIYTPVPKVRQKEALEYINRNVFTEPTWLTSERYMSRITPTPQKVTVNVGLNALFRLTDSYLLNNMNTEYSVYEYLKDLTSMLFSGTDMRSRMSGYRMALQASFVRTLVLAFETNPRNAACRPAVLQTLRTLRDFTSRASAAAPDGESRAHYASLNDVIQRALLVK